MDIFFIRRINFTFFSSNYLKKKMNQIRNYLFDIFILLVNINIFISINYSSLYQNLDESFLIFTKKENNLEIKNEEEKC